MTWNFSKKCKEKESGEKFHWFLSYQVQFSQLLYNNRILFYRDFMCQTVYSCFFWIAAINATWILHSSNFLQHPIVLIFISLFRVNMCIPWSRKVVYFMLQVILWQPSISLFFRQKDRCQKKFAIVMGRGLSPQKWATNSAKHSRLVGGEVKGADSRISH